MGTIRSRVWKRQRVWFIDYAAADGRRIRQTIGAGEEGRRLARQVLVQREAEATLGRHHIPASQTMRFAEFGDDWLKRVANRIRPKTRESYEDMLKRHLVPWFGEMRLGAITRREVEAYLAHKVATGTRRGKRGKPVPLTANTINHTLTTLKAIVQDAIEQGLLTESSALRAKPLRDPRRDDGEKVRALEPDQLEALLGVGEEPWRTLWRVMGRAGLRRGEALALRWSDLDFQKGQLHIQRSLGRIQRQEGKGYEVQETPLKTRYSRRVVPLSPDILDALRGLEIEAVVQGKAEGYVFRSKAGGAIDPDNVDHRFKGDLKLAKLPGLFRVHDLRHTAASHMLAAGIPMKTVQAVLGHASFRTTADTYGHLLESSLDDVGERLRAFLQGKLKANKNDAVGATVTKAASVLEPPRGVEPLTS